VIATIAAIAVWASGIDRLIADCAPNVGPVTMRAIVSVESGGDPLAIDDDTARASYHPHSLGEAQQIAQTLLLEGHNFDAGLAQVNSANFAAQGLTVATMFDPCANLRAGADILGRSYAAASHLLWIGHPPRTAEDVRQQEQAALRHAFSIYNSGSAWRSLRYADKVFAAAARERPFTVVRVVRERPAFATTFATPQRARSGFSADVHPTIGQLQARSGLTLTPALRSDLR
jgi:type IV secretion system protein VirB1